MSHVKWLLDILTEIVKIVYEHIQQTQLTACTFLTVYCGCAGYGLLVTYMHVSVGV